MKKYFVVNCWGVKKDKPFASSKIFRFKRKYEKEWLTLLDSFQTPAYQISYQVAEDFDKALYFAFDNPEIMFKMTKEENYLYENLRGGSC